MALAPRGAYFFQIIILYCFHEGSRTLVFIQARLNPAPVNRNIWEFFRLDNNKGLCQDDSIKDVCSPWSYGLKYCILQLDRAALGDSFPKMERTMFLGIWSKFLEFHRKINWLAVHIFCKDGRKTFFIHYWSTADSPAEPLYLNLHKFTWMYLILPEFT